MLHDIIISAFSPWYAIDYIPCLDFFSKFHTHVLKPPTQLATRTTEYSFSLIAIFL